MDRTSRPVTSELLAVTADDLARHAPFDRMTRRELEWLAARLSVVYFAPEAIVLSPDNGVPHFLHIIKQGALHGFGVDAPAAEAPRWLLSAGDSFPLGALLGTRPVTNIYRAAGDLFCYRLPADDFRTLMQDSPTFREFATKRLATLLVESRRTQRIDAAGNSAQPLERPLRDVLPADNVICTAGEPLRSVLQRMRLGRADAAVVSDDAGNAVGIFTLRDLRDRVVLRDTGIDCPMDTVMTPAPVSLPGDVMAYEAALTMAERGFRHVVVMVDGRAAGCVSDGDLFAFARLGVPAISSAVRNAPDLAALTRAAGQVRELTRDLGQQAMPAEQLTRMVATLNDLVTIRALELVADDCGIARDGYCWLAFGSEGRHEQTFATDQDNGLVFHPPVDGDIESVRSAFIRFARRVNEALAQCGFPLCHGEVMAGNPRWCLTLVEWQAAFGTWLRTPDAESLLHASIFFDMRPLYGDLALGTALRDWLSATSSGHTVFLRLLAENALQREAPLGLLRDFVVEDHGGRTGTIDLKTNGAALFVDAARVLSLAAGDTHAGTAARLRAVAEQRQLARTEVDAWLDAFHFVQRLRVEHQLRCLAEGRATENYVAPDHLNALDRRILKEALRQGRKLQERLRLDFRL